MHSTRDESVAKHASFASMDVQEFGEDPQMAMQKMCRQQATSK